MTEAGRAGLSRLRTHSLIMLAALGYRGFSGCPVPGPGCVGRGETGVA